MINHLRIRVGLLIATEARTESALVASAVDIDGLADVTLGLKRLDTLTSLSVRRVPDNDLLIRPRLLAWRVKTQVMAWFRTHYALQLE